MQRIEVTLIEDDFVNVSCFANFRRKSTRKLFRRLQILLAVLFSLIIGGANFFVNDEDWLEFRHMLPMLILLPLSAYWVINLPRAMRKDMRKKIRKMIRETHSEHFGRASFMELRDDGLFFHCDKFESISPYSEIDDAIEHEGCTYVPQDKAHFYIFPHDRIPKETLDAFLDELKTRKAAACGNSSDLSTK